MLVNSLMLINMLLLLSVTIMITENQSDDSFKGPICPLCLSMKHLCNCVRQLQNTGLIFLLIRPFINETIFFSYKQMF